MSFLSFRDRPLLDLVFPMDTVATQKDGKQKEPRCTGWDGKDVTFSERTGQCIEYLEQKMRTRR
jgi:hypothetical protein